MGRLEWKKKFGVLGDEVVEVEAYEVEGGYIVRRSACMRDFVEASKLFDTRAQAEARLAALGKAVS